MTFSPILEIPSSSLMENIDCDDQKFRVIVFDFIEEIGKQLLLYEDGSNISANDFKYIELQTQAHRVVKVLHLCIEKIRLIFHLSHILKNRNNLPLLFCQNDAEKLDKFALNWIGAHMPNKKFETDLSDCLALIGRSEVNMNKHQVSRSEHNILLLLNELKQVTERRIEMTASMEMAKQKILHQLWAANTKNMRKMQKIRKEISDDQQKVLSIETDKQSEIKCYNFERDRMYHNNSMDLNGLIIESNKAMAEICETGRCHQNAATKSMLKAKEMFDTLHKNDICEEKETTEKKIYLEQQLKAFLQVYDHEIGVRSARLEACKSTLEIESNTLAKWQEKYDIQEKLFNQIQADKEAIEEKRREEKILLFMMNRVARIIQRHYRCILAQRKAKKKGKGKKGGRGKK